MYTGKLFMLLEKCQQANNRYGLIQFSVWQAAYL